MTPLFAKSGYNPFFITHNDKFYEIKDIKIYKKDGTIVSTNRGWFGDGNNELENFEIPDVTLRRKPKFDGLTFILPVKNEFHSMNKRLHAHLYIPFEYFDFVETSTIDRVGERILTYPVYVSNKFKGDRMGELPLTVVDRTNAKTDIDYEIKSELESIRQHKERLEKELQELQDREVDLLNGHFDKKIEKIKEEKTDELKEQVMGVLTNV